MIQIYIQILADRLEMTLVDAVSDPQTALAMVGNLRAQGFRAVAVVAVGR